MTSPNWNGDNMATSFPTFPQRRKASFGKNYIYDILVDAVTPILDRKLSVLDLISMKLPPISLHSASYMVPAGHSFFSIEDPSDNYLDILSSGVVPPKNIVAELLSKVVLESPVQSGYLVPIGTN